LYPEPLKKVDTTSTKCWHFVEVEANSKKLQIGLGHLGVNIIFNFVKLLDFKLFNKNNKPIGWSDTNVFLKMDKL
jgi:hypothetical protein